MRTTESVLVETSRWLERERWQAVLRNPDPTNPCTGQPIVQVYDSHSTSLAAAIDSNCVMVSGRGAGCQEIQVVTNVTRGSGFLTVDRAMSSLFSVMHGAIKRTMSAWLYFKGGFIYIWIISDLLLRLDIPEHELLALPSRLQAPGVRRPINVPYLHPHAFKGQPPFAGVLSVMTSFTDAVQADDDNYAGVDKLKHRSMNCQGACSNRKGMPLESPHPVKVRHAVVEVDHAVF